MSSSGHKNFRRLLNPTSCQYILCTDFNVQYIEVYEESCALVKQSFLSAIKFHSMSQIIIDSFMNSVFKTITTLLAMKFFSYVVMVWMLRGQCNLNRKTFLLLIALIAISKRKSFKIRPVFRDFICCISIIRTFHYSDRLLTLEKGTYFVRKSCTNVYGRGIVSRDNYEIRGQNVLSVSEA